MFVTANAQRAKQMGLRRNNNPSTEARVRATTVWSVYEMLQNVGINRDIVTIARGRVYEIDAEGNARGTSKLDGKTISWNDAVPAGLRNGE